MTDGAVIEKPLVGVIASDPKTGECFYASSEEPQIDELTELITCGSLVQLKGLREVSLMFLKSEDSRKIVETGECVAKYLGRDIPAWIKTGDGMVHEYQGIFSKNRKVFGLDEGQCMVGGLIYKCVSA